jgi:hypothetical protein
MFTFIVTLFDLILYYPLFNLLVLIYNYLPGHDFGIAVIILTLIIKIVLYPLSVKAIRSQQVNQRIQPQLQEIQKKYKDDKEKQSLETLELKFKKGIEKLLQAFVADGTLGSYNRGLSSGKMNAADFIGDFTNKILGALRGQIKTVNDRGNWENQPMDTDKMSVVTCPKCHAAFNYNEQPEVAMGAINCPFCNTTMNQDGEKL